MVAPSPISSLKASCTIRAKRSGGRRTPNGSAAWANHRLSTRGKPRGTLVVAPPARRNAKINGGAAMARAGIPIRTPTEVWGYCRHRSHEMITRCSWCNQGLGARPVTSVVGMHVMSGGGVRVWGMGLEACMLCCVQPRLRMAEPQLSPAGPIRRMRPFTPRTSPTPPKRYPLAAALRTRAEPLWLPPPSPPQGASHAGGARGRALNLATSARE